MSEIKQLKRFVYSAMVTSGSGSQSFYIDAESREEADERAANNESDDGSMLTIPKLLTLTHLIMKTRQRLMTLVTFH
ncbi:hypothetical protein [Yersinia enterocolitica]|uniref:hypothetical protein n=1 Tax=Yersinia enterocolitica TaxID=630 RepID=UPI003D79E079